MAEAFGTLPMSDLLGPATELAREGFAVTPITAHQWKNAAHQLLESQTSGEDLLVREARTGKLRAPLSGELFRNEKLARVLDELAERGKEGFYCGWIAESMVEAVASRGGVLSMDDLSSHASEFGDPISTTYRGIEVYQEPPPKQGIVALMALNLSEEKIAYDGK